jgi:hypothetical protein
MAATPQPPTAGYSDQVAFDAMTANIRKTIDDQNDMYNTLKSASNSSFASERKTYNINQGVNDAKSQRDEIWRFLQDKYNENTNLRKYLFEKDLANKRELESHEKELNYLKKNVADSNTQYDTSTRNIQNEMYNRNRYIYMFHLYKLLILVQFIIIIIILTRYYEAIPNIVSIIAVLAILFITVLYIIYYVYFNNNNRNSFDWNKFYYGEPNISGAGKCAPVVSAEEQELTALASNVDTILGKYIDSASSCKPTGTPRPTTMTMTPLATATATATATAPPELSP